MSPRPTLRRETIANASLDAGKTLLELYDICKCLDVRGVRVTRQELAASQNSPSIPKGDLSWEFRFYGIEDGFESSLITTKEIWPLCRYLAYP